MMGFTIYNGCICQQTGDTKNWLAISDPMINYYSNEWPFHIDHGGFFLLAKIKIRKCRGGCAITCGKNPTCILSRRNQRISVMGAKRCTSDISSAEKSLEIRNTHNWWIVLMDCYCSSSFHFISFSFFLLLFILREWRGALLEFW